MELITGYAGQAHITASDDAALHRGIIGSYDAVLDVDDGLACEVVYNNQVRIKSGVAIFQGRLVRIRANTYDTLIVENGTQALIRHDIIVIRYTKTDSIESAELVVVKGIPGNSGSDPVVNTNGSIDNGDILCDMPLYRIVLNGLNITRVDVLYNVSKTIDKLENAYKELESLLVRTAKETENALNNKANIGHIHDDRYYTEAEVNDMMLSKSNIDHIHDDRYYTEAEINNMVSTKNGQLDINQASFQMLNGSIKRVGNAVFVNLYVKSYDNVMANYKDLIIGHVAPLPGVSLPFSVVDDGMKMPLAAKLDANGALVVVGNNLSGERYLMINLAYAVE